MMLESSFVLVAKVEMWVKHLLLGRHDEKHTFDLDVQVGVLNSS